MVACGGLRGKFLDGAYLTVAVERDLTPILTVSIHSICSGGWIFLLKQQLCHGVPVVRKVTVHNIGDNSTPTDHSLQWKIHKPIISRTTTSFLADLSLQHENCITLSNTTASPRSPTGFNLQERKKKKSANSICWWVPPHNREGLGD